MEEVERFLTHLMNFLERERRVERKKREKQMKKEREDGPLLFLHSLLPPTVAFPEYFFLFLSLASSRYRSRESEVTVGGEREARRFARLHEGRQTDLHQIIT